MASSISFPPSLPDKIIKLSRIGREIKKEIIKRHSIGRQGDRLTPSQTFLMIPQELDVGIVFKSYFKPGACYYQPVALIMRLNLL